MQERWTPVVIFHHSISDHRYDHYEVSTRGRLRRVGSDRILKGTTSKKGYRNIELQPKKDDLGGTPLVTQIGTLVAYAFLGAPPSSEHLVARINQDPGDDGVNNLEYATRSEIWLRKNKKVARRKKRMLDMLAIEREEVQAQFGDLLRALE